MNDITDEIKDFLRERDWEKFHTPKNIAMALSVEAAEITEIFQWLTPEESLKLPPDKIAQLRQEIGDVYIYLSELAGRFGLDPMQCAREKITLNREKYPVGKSKGRANKYTELE